jgi:methyl-accepting chemotaxis protein
MSYLEKIKKASLQKRLLFFSLLTSGLSSLVFLGVFYYITKIGITEQLNTTMQRVRLSKIAEINRYFHGKETDLIGLAHSLDVKEAMIEFRDSYGKLKATNGGNLGVFEYLHKYYIIENPFKTGEKDFLEIANDGSDYSKVHKKYHSFFREMLKAKRYYDFFLVDKEGNIVYSVFKESDYATNLETGKYSESNLGRLYRETKRSGDISRVTFTDFDNYEPSKGEPASFIGIPIMIDGKNEGAFLAQLPIDEINQIMEDRSLGNSGTVYLIGSDYKLRNQDMKNPKENSILRKKIENQAAKDAIQGREGILLVEDSYGTEVFSSFSSIEIFNTKYGILVDQDYDEAMEGLFYIRNRILILAFIVILFSTIAAYFLSIEFSQQVGSASHIISSSMGQIAATIQQQEKTANLQSASVSETTSTMSELASSSKHTAEQSETVAERAKETQSLAESGATNVEELMTSMDELRSRVNNIAEEITQLSEKNNQIGNIIKLVSDLANQTNMLALNAAVEAARAGEYGKGFAVVAVEIRKLADESKKSAEKIQEIINEIKKATDSTVMVTEEGTKKVSIAFNLGKQAFSSFQGVKNSIKGVFESTEQISLNVKQQAIAINEVVQAMNNLSRGSQETAHGITETRSGLQQLQVATTSLKTLVDGQQ